MIEPRKEQVNAMGGATPCKPAEPFKSANGPVADPGKDTTPASVVVVDPNKKAWIAIELKDRKKRPVPNQAWEVVLPNGQTVTGNLDRNGKTRLEGIDPGQCKVTFPELDRREFI